MKITLSPIVQQENFVSFNVLVTSSTRKNRLAGQLGMTHEEFSEFVGIMKGATKRKNFDFELHPHLADIA